LPDAQAGLVAPPALRGLDAMPGSDIFVAGTYLLKPDPCLLASFASLASVCGTTGSQPGLPVTCTVVEVLTMHVPALACQFKQTGGHGRLDIVGHVECTAGLHTALCQAALPVMCGRWMQRQRCWCMGSGPSCGAWQPTPCTHTCSLQRVTAMRSWSGAPQPAR
jgi:hypothetical protein